MGPSHAPSLHLVGFAVILSRNESDWNGNRLLYPVQGEKNEVCWESCQRSVISVWRSSESRLVREKRRFGRCFGRLLNFISARRHQSNERQVRPGYAKGKKNCLGHARVKYFEFLTLESSIPTLLSLVRLSTTSLGC